LFYLDANATTVGIGSGSKMLVVEIAAGSQFRAGIPRMLFVLPDGFSIASMPTRSYDVYPDGQHLIMKRPEVRPVPPVTKLNVVLNWSEELKRRAPVGK
jgi:hypothetical protein